MAQAEKLLEKLRAKPTPNDFRWDELVVVLRHLGYVMLANKGSRRRFYNQEKDDMIQLHQPHPGSEVRPCYIKEIREKLEEMGLIKSEG